MFSKIADFLTPRSDSERKFDIGIRITVGDPSHYNVEIVKILISSVDPSYHVTQIFEAPFHVWRPRDDDFSQIHEAYVHIEHIVSGKLTENEPQFGLPLATKLYKAFEVVSKAKSMCLKIDVNDCTDNLRRILNLIPPCVPCSELSLKHIVDAEDYQVFADLVKRLKIPGLCILKPYLLSSSIVKPLVDLFNNSERWDLKKLEFYSNKPINDMESILTVSEMPVVMVDGRTIEIEFLKSPAGQHGQKE
ncbi:hypothetical protein L596_013720 [Steinernema carpocapsae]|uniref:Uncharacterized protein n=1 Tax=Steinernema carpocapsae TaxID=34508 RepID=A0A4U5P1P8_STECR|nr:hypothetical protein L596_013720 [Steinernema carpocapsae]